MIQTFVDDNTEPPVFLLAGFVARAEHFVELTRKWKAALAKPPKLAYFKMKEAHARRGQFWGWSVLDRDARLADLVSIIKEHVLARVSAVVRQDEYHAVLRDRIAKPLDSPYWLMYHSIMALVFEWDIESGLAEKVDFIFDEQLHQSDRVQAHFGAFYDLAPERIKALFGKRPRSSERPAGFTAPSG